MNKQHKHAELIKAWADGAIIQYWRKTYGWEDCIFNDPCWHIEAEYRIKPESKPDHVYYGVFEMSGSMSLEACFTKINDGGDELKLTFDGETGKLKSAEVL
jgi:hypothetical protein